MKLHLIPREQQITSSWAGGTTTQLFIFPETATLAERNFIFRISTATVETEHSDFSSFPAYKRILMILEGSLHINHAGHYSKQLHAFDTDEFNGNWKTSADGKVRDFNVIYADDKTAGIEKKELSAGEIHLHPFADNDFLCLYLLKGNAEVAGQQMRKGDFIYAGNPIIENVMRIKAIDDSSLLCCYLKL